MTEGTDYGLFSISDVSGDLIVTQELETAEKYAVTIRVVNNADARYFTEKTVSIYYERKH